MKEKTDSSTVNFDVKMIEMMTNLGKIAWKVERIRVAIADRLTVSRRHSLKFPRYFAEIFRYFCYVDVKVHRQQCCCLSLFHSGAIFLFSSRFRQRSFSRRGDCAKYETYEETN